MEMSTADRVTAIALAALGLSMSIGGYRMDRLEIRGVHPASIPGLVPMILGVLLVVCALLLWRDAPRNEQTRGASILTDGSWTRLGLTAATCLAYALVLIGWLPFLWATALFVFAFAAIFSWPAEADRRGQAEALAGAASLAIATGWGTALLFSEVFLVRLP